MAKRKSIQERAPLTTEELERLTANDLLRLKMSDDEKSRLRAINQAREAKRQASVARLQAESAPIVMDLQAVGLRIQSIDELMKISGRYDQAIPVLLHHLQLPYSDLVKSAIARALAVPEPLVRDAWSVLVEAYRKAPIGRGIVAKGDTEEFRLGSKDALACVLAVAATEETIAEVIDLLKDPTQGESRVLLLSALRASKNPIVQKTIDDLSHDPQLREEIASW
jgi:hypothetical protein